MMCIWYIIQAPMIILCLILLIASFSIQAFYYRNFSFDKTGNLVPNRFILFILKIDKICIKEVTENLPKNFLDWMIHPEEKQTKDNIMKAINSKTPHEFVTKAEKKLPPEKQTSFKVRFLTASQQAEIRDTLYNVSGLGKARKERIQTGTADLQTLKYGLVGWSNFLDDNGSPVNFDLGKIDDMIDMIPPEARSEIASHVRGESEVTEGE